MSSKICPKCGTANSADMAFCTNCGQSLSQSAPRTDEPPPTVFMNQPAVTNPNQPAMPPNVASMPPQPPKKGGKGWIYGLAGCLGLLLISGIGLAIVIALGIGGGVFDDSNTVSVSTSPTPAANKERKNSTPAEKPLTSGDTSGSLVKILESKKTVGAFNQIELNNVVTKDYFPEATGAAQATYKNNSEYVYLTVGQFESFEAAKKNFEDQLNGVKSGDGKVTYRDTASDGTVSAIYETKYEGSKLYFAEYCNTNKYCNRIHSANREALRSFIDDYAQ